MDKLIAKIKRIVAENFPGAKLQLSRRTGQVEGVLVWQGFDRMFQIDRQVKLRRAINASLSAQDRPKVSFILTMTEMEQKAIADEERRPAISRRKKTA
jgi:hypothetical protein